MRTLKKSHLTNAVLAALVVIAVLALAGVSLAGNGKGNGGGKGKGHDDEQGKSSAKQQYGSAGKQYGHHRVLLCHKGKHTIRVAPPAVKAHLRHGDKLGAC
jgi:hypothetical protein